MVLRESVPRGSRRSLKLYSRPLVSRTLMDEESLGFLRPFCLAPNLALKSSRRGSLLRWSCGAVAAGAAG